MRCMGIGSCLVSSQILTNSLSTLLFLAPSNYLGLKLMVEDKLAQGSPRYWTNITTYCFPTGNRWILKRDPSRRTDDGLHHDRLYQRTKKAYWWSECICSGMYRIADRQGSSGNTLGWKVCRISDRDRRRSGEYSWGHCKPQTTTARPKQNLHNFLTTGWAGVWCRFCQAALWAKLVFYDTLQKKVRKE